MSQVVNKFLAQMPADTLKGNNTGSLANPMDLTVADVNTMLGTNAALAATGVSAFKVTFSDFEVTPTTVGAAGSSHAV